MSEFFDQEDDEDGNNFQEAEQRLQDLGLIGTVLQLGCAQVEGDFLSVRRIGDVEHAVENLEPVVSVMLHISEVTAIEGLISGGVMLTAEGARVLAAHLLNSADEIDGFHAMFEFSTVEEGQDE